MKCKSGPFGLLLVVVTATATTAWPQASSGETGFGSVRGHVRDEKDRPLSAIKVRAISRRSDQTVAEVRTDEAGNYELVHLPVGRYALSFFAPEHRTSSVDVVDVHRNEATQVKDVVMVRTKPFAVVAGSTFNEEGFVLGGVRVVLERVPFASEPVGSLKLEQRSNASGEFAFRLGAEKARYRLTASAPGFETAVTAVEIEGAERRNTALRLRPKK